MTYPYGITVTMGIAESAIAQGWGFRLPFRISANPLNTTQQTIAAGDSAYISIRHSTKSIMLIGRELACDRPDVFYTVHKNPTIAAYGAPVTLRPLNGENVIESANTCNIVAPADVTAMGEEVDFGTPIVGGNPNTGGSPYSDSDFKILPNDSDYLLRIHNLSGNVVDVFSLSLKWCEFEPAYWK